MAILVRRRLLARVEPCRKAVGPLARMQAADQAVGLRPLAAGQHTADLVPKHDQVLNLAAAVPR
jgi:hypothetical protein